MNNVYRSDLYKIHNIVQSSMLTYPKQMIIAVLRDYFAQDSYYHYTKDEWGYPKTIDQTGLPLEAGLKDNTTTRLFIGENYRYDGIFYPALFVKANSSKSVPISINREQGAVQYEKIVYDDGYNQIEVSRPQSFITAGIYEGNFSIDVQAKDMRTRDELVDLVVLCFTEIYFDVLYESGIVVKQPISVGGPSEQDDRNDKLFKQTVSLDIRTEWRREIPISSLIDTILFTVDFANLDDPDSIISANLTINTQVP